MELSILNTATPPIFLRDSYILDIINNDPGQATNTSVDLIFPNNLVITDTGDCIINNGSGSLTWAVGVLGNGNSDQCIFGVEIILPGEVDRYRRIRSQPLCDGEQYSHH